MFLLPQTSMEAVPLDTGYVMCALQQSMPIGVMVASQDPGSGLGIHAMHPGAYPHQQCQLSGALATQHGGKKPGEAFAASRAATASQKQQKNTDSAASKARKALLLPLSSHEGKMAARALAQRVEEARRVKACRNTFSALNIDVVRRAPDGSPGAQSVSEATQKQDAAAKDVGDRVKRQFSIMSRATSAPDSDGKESELSSPSNANDEWEELPLPEASFSEVKPNFGEVRNSLLGFRFLPSGQPPRELSGLVVVDTKAPPRSPAPKPARVPPSGSPRAGATPLHRSRSQIEDLQRTVQSLLNKVCPENVDTVVERLAAIQVQDLHQLETIIELIFKKALMEPHYCETYADMVYGLKTAFPEFPSPETGKPIGFKSSVLNICQNEFEELLSIIKPGNSDGGEEFELKRASVAGRMRGNMKFIGHLFLRRLISAKVIGSVLCELVLCEFVDYLPEETAIECACELLNAVGYTLETMPAGGQAVKQVCSRLLDLKTRKVEGKAAYCKRIQFMIMDVLDARAAGWTRKLFKSSAKTKEEIRLEQAQDVVEEMVVAGLRPQYLEGEA